MSKAYIPEREENTMFEVGAYEAKTHLPKLLAQVEQGEQILITKHGHPVAKLVPVTGCSREEVVSAIDRLKTFQAKHRLNGLTIRELIEEGRRF